MIEKLDIIRDSENCVDAFGDTHNVAGHNVINKVNELCDIINTIQKEREAEWFEIKEWIGILEAVRKSVNVHEKQIDELQMKLEPEKCEPTENVYTKTCRMDKEFAEEELARTKKKLDIAIDVLRHADWFFDGDYVVYARDMHNEIKYAIKAITAPEQKE